MKKATSLEEKNIVKKEEEKEEKKWKLETEK